MIHRDLKPQNVMVGDFGETLVIDWGLARVMGRPDGDTTPTGWLKLSGAAAGPETRQGDVFGTPACMPPEQALGQADRVGMASDVWALGAMLYSVLTGQAPYGGDDVLAQAKRGDVVPARQAKRSAPSALEAVCQKAMAKESRERYAGAKELAAEVERWLADEPVTAYRDPWLSRTARWARKHRTTVATAATGLLVALAGLATGLVVVGGLNQRLEAANEGLIDSNTKLTAALAEVEKKQKEAEAERNIARAVRDFLRNKLLGQADPRTQADSLLQHGGSAAAVNHNVTVRELLDRAAEELTPERIEASFPKQPWLQAEILLTVGDTYRGVGEPAVAVAFLQRVAALYRQRLPPDHAATLVILNNLAMAYRDAGRTDEAIPLLKHVRAIRENRLGADHPDTLNTLLHLAWAYRDAGRTDEAIRLFEHVKAIWENKLGADHRHTLAALVNLARAYQDAGRTDDAVRLFERIPEAIEKRLGADHPSTLTTLDNLAGTYRVAGRTDEAVRLLERVRDARERKLGADHPDTLTTLKNLAAAYWAAKQLDKAIHLLEDALKRSEGRLGRDHPGTLWAMAYLGVSYRDAGRLKEALPLLEKAHAKSGPHARLAWVGRALLSTYIKAGKNSEAARLLADRLADSHKYRPAGGWELADELLVTGRSLLELKRPADAEPLLRECLALHEKLVAKQQAQHWQVGSVRSLLGSALLGQGKAADAEPLLLSGYDTLQKEEKAIPPWGKDIIPQALRRLVELYDATGKKDQAAKWNKELDAAKAPSKK